MGRDGDLDKAGAACIALESQLARLTEGLRKLTRDSSMRKRKTGKAKGRNG
jgi:hypothetical protein